MADNIYRMALSLNVLEHLGLNLYSNVPSVLSEIVANAWDADAANVRIDLDRTNDRIVIKDDGAGMTTEEVNDRFLTVGYRRRDGQPGLTGKGRVPMGRKGIGKLSLFSIARIIEVYTEKKGERSAFRMRLDEIRSRIKNGSGTYEPETMDAEAFDGEQGTRIVLSELRHRQTLGTSKALRRRLARRFCIVGAEHGFRIFVDGEEIVPADRDYYDKIQYLWTYGGQSEVLAQCSNRDHHEDRTSVVDGKSPRVVGWLGTVRESKHLKDEEGDNLNRIAIHVRGKMAQEDILADFTERGVYASYLIGELRVDDLDVDGDDDAATSSRQRIVEDDPRYVDLRKIIGDELKHIQKRWSEWREEAGALKALEIPAVKTWMNGLPKDLRPRAKKWLGKINKIRTDDVGEQKQLIKHSVLAFEFFRCNENLERLEGIDDDNLPTAIEIFRELDGLEANLYGQIVQQRITVIRTLQEKVDQNAREKAIQEYIFDHLWLIEPHWERTDAPPLMETRVSNLFQEIVGTLSREEREARIDIKYRKTAGGHVIVELKRPDRLVGLYELAEQIDKYHDGMMKLLDGMGRGNEPVEFVCLLGRPLKEAGSPRGDEKIKDTLRPLRARVVLYDQLLADAYAAYIDFLEKRKSVDTLAEIIAAIEDYAPSEPHERPADQTGT